MAKKKDESDKAVKPPTPEERIAELKKLGKEGLAAKAMEQIMTRGEDHNPMIDDEIKDAYKAIIADEIKDEGDDS